jgi:SLT domain-containing protein
MVQINLVWLRRSACSDGTSQSPLLVPGNHASRRQDPETRGGSEGDRERRLRLAQIAGGGRYESAVPRSPDRSHALSPLMEMAERWARWAVRRMTTARNDDARNTPLSDTNEEVNGLSDCRSSTIMDAEGIVEVVDARGYV